MEFQGAQYRLAHPTTLLFPRKHRSDGGGYLITVASDAVYTRVLTAGHMEQGGGSRMVLVRRYVCITQNIRFIFQIFQPMLNDIANADDTDKIAVSNHEQMPQTVIRHQAHGALQGIARRNRDCGMGRDVQYRRGESSLPMPRDRVHDVAF